MEEMQAVRTEVYQLERVLDQHDEHCANCIYSDCKYELCPIVHCPCCDIRLHNCKTYDHLEICSMKFCPCINAEYGCNREIRRDKMSNHLLVCPASCVVCPEETMRTCLNRIAKDLLKTWARKGRVASPKVPIGEEEVDVLMAFSDQQKIVESYRFSKKTRTQCSDGMSPYPILPLRPLLDVNGNSRSTLAQEGEPDSEDEAKNDYRKKKVDSMFSNCLICTRDPTMQHLHTLGDGRTIANYTSKRRETPASIDPFYEQRALAISTTTSFPVNINKKYAYSDRATAGKIFKVRCEQTIRRDEWSAHLLLSHSRTQNDLDRFVLRCPLWTAGCDFHAVGTEPENGRLKFSSYLDTFEITPFREPEVLSSDSAECPILDLPIAVLECITSFLESCSLRSLAATCSDLREALFSSLPHRAVVALRWRKREGKWFPDQKVWSFSVASRGEPAWRIRHEARVELIEHLQNCPFNTKRDDLPKRCPMFPEPFFSELQIHHCDEDSP